MREIDAISDLDSASEIVEVGAGVSDPRVKVESLEGGTDSGGGIVAEVGTEALQRLFTSPDTLPTIKELDDPAAWVARTL